ncbi:MAG: flagellin [Planctomycetota bacterium]
MAIDPIAARSTNSLTRDTILRGLNRSQLALLLVQEQLSTGKRLVRPSIDPVGTSLALGYRGRIDRNAAYVKNSNDAFARLGYADASLGGVSDLLDSARSIALGEATGTATAATRLGAATEVGEMINQLLSLANAQFEGRPVFGGASKAPPFATAAGGVAFTGDLSAILRSFGDALVAPDNIAATNALGATALLEAQATGSSTAATGAATLTDSSFIGHGTDAYVGYDLVVRTGPNAGLARRITAFSSATGTFTFASAFPSAFAGGEGYDIRLDLDPTVTRGGKAGAATAASGPGTIVTAALTGDGDNAYNSLELRVLTGANAGAVRQITDFDSATGTLTFGTPFGAAFAAGDTFEIRAASTQLGQLRGGLGVNLGSLRVQDGVGGPSVVVDLSGAKDVGDVLDAFNNAFGTAALPVTAGLNAAGNGLELTHTAAGTIVVSEEGGGNTAAQLGILTASAGSPLVVTGSDLDPVISQGTQLAQFRGGLGLDKTGLAISNGQLGGTVSLASAFTVEDLTNLVRGAGVQASVEIAADGRSLALRQLLSGGDLRVTNTGGGETASTLGWLDSLRRKETSQLNAGSGVLTSAGPDLRFTTKTGATFDVDLDGATTIAAVIDRINTAAGNVSLGSPVLAYTDEATGALFIDDRGADGGSNFSVAAVGSSFAAQMLGIEKTVVNPAGVDPVLTLTGDPLSATGLRDASAFAALIELRDALVSNDSQRIAAAADRLAAARTTVLNGRAEAGARARRLELTRNRLEDETVTFQGLLSATEDVDFAEAAVRLTQEQIVLEASLASAAKMLQTTLFDFLG